MRFLIHILGSNVTYVAPFTTTTKDNQKTNWPFDETKTTTNPQQQQQQQEPHTSFCLQ